RPSVLYWILQPGSTIGGVGMGVVRMVRPWNEWLLIWGYDIDGPEPQVDEAEARRIAHRLIGDDSIDVKIRDISLWTNNRAYLTRYSSGRPQLRLGADRRARHPRRGERCARRPRPLQRCAGRRAPARGARAAVRLTRAPAPPPRFGARARPVRRASDGPRRNRIRRRRQPALLSAARLPHALDRPRRLHGGHRIRAGPTHRRHRVARSGLAGSKSMTDGDLYARGAATLLASWVSAPSDGSSSTCRRAVRGPFRTARES